MKKLHVLIMLVMMFLLPQLALASDQDAAGATEEAVEQVTEAADSTHGEMKKKHVENESTEDGEEDEDEEEEEDDDEPDCA